MAGAAGVAGLLTIMMTAKSQAGRIDNPFDIFRPALHMASLIVGHVLSFGIVVLLTYSITGIGGCMLGHRRCGSGRNVLSCLIVTFLTAFCIFAEVRSDSDEAQAGNLLIRNLEFFSAFGVLSTAVLVIMAIGRTLQCTFFQRRSKSDNGCPPRTLCSGNLGACPLLFLLAIITSTAILSHYTQTATSEEIGHLTQTLSTLLSEALSFLVKVSAFLISWFAAIYTFAVACSISTTILTTGFSSLQALWDAVTVLLRDGHRLLTRPPNSTMSFYAQAALQLYLVAFIMVWDYNLNKRQPALDFWFTTAQVAFGWGLVDVGIVIMACLGKIGYAGWRACVGQSEEDEDEEKAKGLEEKVAGKVKVGTQVNKADASFV